MFPSFDPKMFEAFALNPAGLLGKVHDFQKANFDAAREITENNARAFQQMVAIRDPQAFVTMQPAILQAVIERNTQVLTRLWTSLGEGLAPQGAKGRKK